MLEVFAELGVVFLLFWVGLETRLSDLREVGPTAISVGVLGVAIPFAGGFALGAALGESTATSLFIGAALVATSVGITSAVLIELGVLDTARGRTILGAAIVDDILALLLVAVAVGRRRRGRRRHRLDRGHGRRRARLRRLRRARRDAAARGAARAAARPAVLRVAAAARGDHLPRSRGVRGADRPRGDHRRVPRRDDRRRDARPVADRGGVAPLYAFFPPFFFAFIGLEVSLAALGDLDTLLLLAGITILAIATKFAGAYVGALRMGRRDATFVGVGMVPRGEVGIIVAGIGNATGTIDARALRGHRRDVRAHDAGRPARPAAARDRPIAEPA